MKLLIFLTALTVALAAYVTVIRPWMRKRPWAQGFFNAIEPLERVLYSNSEMLLWSRFKTLIGSLLSAAVLFDWSSVSPILPEKWRPYALAAPTIFIALDGLIGEPLRRDITKPLPIVAMRTDADAEAKLAAAKAAEANEKAVKKVEETGAA